MSIKKSKVGTDWILAKTSDLKIGLEYIYLSENLTPTERKASHHILKLRSKLPKENIDSYILYKDFIKRSVEHENIWIKIK